MAYKQISKQRIKELIERFRQVEDLDPRQTYERLKDLRDDEGWRYGEGFNFPPKKVSDRKLKELVWEEITVGGRTRSFFGLRSPPSDEDGVKCQYCDQTFKNANAALEHIAEAHPNQDQAVTSGGAQNINVNIQGAQGGGGAGGAGVSGGSGGGMNWSAVHEEIAETVADVSGLGPSTEQQIRRQVTAMQNGNLSQVDLRNIAGGSRKNKIRQHIVPIFEKYDVPYVAPEGGGLSQGQASMVQRAKNLFERGEHGEKIARVERIVDFLDASDPLRAQLLEWETGELERAQEILWEDANALENYFDKARLRRLMRNMSGVGELEEFRNKYLKGRESDVSALEGTNVPGGVTGLPRYAMKKMIRSVERQERIAPFAAMVVGGLLVPLGMAVGLGPFGIIFGAVFFGWGYHNLESQSKLLGSSVSIGAIYVAALDVVFILTNVVTGGIDSLMTLYGGASLVVLAVAIYLIDWDMVKWAYENFATYLFGPKGERDAGYEMLFFFTVVLAFLTSVSIVLQTTAVAIGASSDVLFRMVAFFLSILGPIALYHFSKQFHAYHQAAQGYMSGGGGGGPQGPPQLEGETFPNTQPALEGRTMTDTQPALEAGEQPVAALPSGNAWDTWEHQIGRIRDNLGSGMTAGVIRQLANTLMEIVQNPEKAMENRNVSEDDVRDAVSALETAYSIYVDAKNSESGVNKDTYSDVKDVVDDILNILGRRR